MSALDDEPIFMERIEILRKVNLIKGTLPVLLQLNRNTSFLVFLILDIIHKVNP